MCQLIPSNIVFVSIVIVYVVVFSLTFVFKYVDCVFFFRFIYVFFFLKKVERLHLPEHHRKHYFELIWHQFKYPFQL